MASKEPCSGPSWGNRSALTLTVNFAICAMNVERMAEQAGVLLRWLRERARPEGLHTTRSGRAVIFDGGIPLKAGGRIIGAVGVSGGQVPEDIAIAEAGARSLAGMVPTPGPSERIRAL